jgi:phosphatidylinositol-3-phosphatase
MYLFITMKKLLLTLATLALVGTKLIAQTLPKPDHVVIVMLENRGSNNIVGSVNAPYLNSLIADTNCALFSDSHGITHPSQPNYVHLYSGANQGITTDNLPVGTPYSTCNLGYNLINNGYTFGGYSEDLPTVGDMVFTLGKYVRRHCPWTNWIGTAVNQIAASVHMPYTSLPANLNTLPTVSFIIPNNDHNMHDPVLFASTAISNGDTWLSTNMPALVTWAKQGNNLVIIQYDEDENFLGLPTNNIIPTLFIGKMVQGGVYNNNFNHHGLLKTIEDMYSLPACDSSAFKQPITNCWRPFVTNNLASKNTTKTNDLKVFPMPAMHTLNVTVNGINNETTQVALYTITGQLVQMYNTKNNINMAIDVTTIDAGTYIIKAHNTTLNETQKIIIEK